MIGTALGAEDFNSAPGVAVLGAVVRRDELEFAYRFHRWNGKHDAAALGPGGHHTVEQDVLGTLLRAVDVGCSGRAGDSRGQQDE